MCTLWRIINGSDSKNNRIKKDKEKRDKSEKNNESDVTIIYLEKKCTTKHANQNSAKYIYNDTCTK